jgi:hypothetical protein
MNARQRRVYRRKFARRIETWNELVDRFERQLRVYDHAFHRAQQYIVDQVREHLGAVGLEDVVAAVRAAYPDINTYYKWSQSNELASTPCLQTQARSTYRSDQGAVPQNESS